MLCKIGTTEAPFSVRAYSTRGGISSKDLRDTIPFAINAFKVEASTASVILPISLRNSLYRSICFAANTQTIREFHLPPKISKPYSSGHRMSFSNFRLYIRHTLPYAFYDTKPAVYLQVTMKFISDSTICKYLSVIESNRYNEDNSKEIAVSMSPLPARIIKKCCNNCRFLRVVS